MEKVAERTARFRDDSMTPAERRIWLVILLSALLVIAAREAAAEQGAEPAKFASASQVESNFRGQSFILGSGDQVAAVQALNWEKDRFIRLPFWLGTGKVVPRTARPRKGSYYVISEAYIVRSLGGNEWLIRAGSKFQKPDAVLVTRKTRYKTTGIILPTIVQYIDTRTITRADGSKIDIAVLQEVSLPMKWTSGPVPASYANFTIRP